MSALAANAPAERVHSAPESVSTPERASVSDSMGAPESVNDRETAGVASSTASLGSSGASAATAAVAISAEQSLGRFLRTRTDRIQLRSWR